MLKKQKRHAFTLLEMAIVLFIISLLVLIILPNLSTQREHATKIHENAMTNVVQTQLDLYENDTGQKAQSIDQLVENQYLTSAQAQKAASEHIKVVNGKAEQNENSPASLYSVGNDNCLGNCCVDDADWLALNAANHSEKRRASVLADLSSSMAGSSGTIKDQ